MVLRLARENISDRNKIIVFTLPSDWLRKKRLCSEGLSTIFGLNRVLVFSVVRLFLLKFESHLKRAAWFQRQRLTLRAPRCLLVRGRFRPGGKSLREVFAYWRKVTVGKRNFLSQGGQLVFVTARCVVVFGNNTASNISKLSKTTRAASVSDIWTILEYSFWNV